MAEVGQGTQCRPCPTPPSRQKHTKVLTDVNNLGHHLNASVTSLRHYSHRRNRHSHRRNSQHGAVEQIAGRIDELDRLFLREDDGQFAGSSRIWHFFDRVVPLQGLAEKKPQRGRVVANRSHSLLPLIEQIQLILPDLVRPKLVWWS